MLMIHATTGLPLPPSDLGEEVSPWSILTTYRGSIAHGMWRPNTDVNSYDDVDLQAVVIPSEPYYVGLKEFGSKGTKIIQHGPWDINYYEARKAVRLMAKGNANLLAMLWVEPAHILSSTSAGALLLQNRDLFLTKAIYRPLDGYAHGQMEDMKKKEFFGYMGDRRKKLVDQFGYDPKAAAHLIRLLRMGVTVFEEGYFEVYRHRDAEELMAIKRGVWTHERVLDEAAHWFERMKIACVNSSLPEEPDWEKVSALCEKMVLSTWDERRELNRG